MEFNEDWQARIDATLKANRERHDLENPMTEEQTQNFPEGTCPFQSTLEKPVPCSEKCQLHRSGKKGFACAFHDLAIMAWNLKPENRNPRT